MTIGSVSAAPAPPNRAATNVHPSGVWASSILASAALSKPPIVAAMTNCPPSNAEFYEIAGKRGDVSRHIAAPLNLLIGIARPQHNDLPQVFGRLCQLNRSPLQNGCADDRETRYSGVYCLGETSKWAEQRGFSTSG